MNRRNLLRLAFLLVIVGVLVGVYVSPLSDWLTLERLAASRDALIAMIAARPVLSAAVFFLICVVASALCFPAAPLIGVAGGALFGLWAGLAILLPGFTLGSTLACLGSRHFLRDWVEAKLGARLAAIDRGFERHGAAYLLALRINPLIPYWLVNLAIGLTPMRMRAYVPLTLIGLSPALFIYANAGSQLATVNSMSEVFSPGLMVSLLLLSLVPIAADRLRRNSEAA